MKGSALRHSVESIVLDTESMTHVACNRQARPRQCTPFRFIRGATIDYRGTIEGSIEDTIVAKELRKTDADGDDDDDHDIDDSAEDIDDEDIESMQ